MMQDTSQGQEGREWEISKPCLSPRDYIKVPRRETEEKKKRNQERMGTTTKRSSKANIETGGCELGAGGGRA